MKDIFIKNFWENKDLEISNLAKINIFVGKNGVGKTKILEHIKSFNDNNIVVYDDTDYGFHFSEQKNHWQLILKTCENSNLQFFFSTHSKEMVENLIKCLEEGKHENFVKVFRIIKNGFIENDQETMKLIVDNGIEFR